MDILVSAKNQDGKDSLHYARESIMVIVDSSGISRRLFCLVTILWCSVMVIPPGEGKYCQRYCEEICSVDVICIIYRADFTRISVTSTLKWSKRDVERRSWT